MKHLLIKAHFHVNQRPWRFLYYSTVKTVLSGHRIKRTPSIKRTVAEGPKFISLIFFK